MADLIKLKLPTGENGALVEYNLKDAGARELISALGNAVKWLGVTTTELVDNVTTDPDITVGGETSYKCCKAINSSNMQIVDAICPAIPLCLDSKAQWIVTKSGNLGNTNTLIDIIKYFGHHE